MAPLGRDFIIQTPRLIRVEKYKKKKNFQATILVTLPSFDAGGGSVVIFSQTKIEDFRRRPKKSK